MLLFVGVSALVIAIPGQDTALTVRNTLLGSRATGVATAFGVGAGQAVLDASRRRSASGLFWLRASPRSPHFASRARPISSGSGSAPCGAPYGA